MSIDLHRSITTTAVAMALAVSVSACDQRAKTIPPQATTSKARAPKAKPYSVSPAQASLPAGQASAVALTIRPAPAFKINKDYNWSITFEAPGEGASLSKRTFQKKDLQLDDAQATVPLEVTVAKPGTHTLQAKADFSVCNDDQCLVLDAETLEFQLEATPPSP